jgi:competence protein ComEC
MRKLAIAAFSFSSAIFAANYICSRETALYAALFFALAGAVVLGIRLKSLRAVVIAAFAVSIGFAVFSLHYDLTVSKARRLSGETRSYSFCLLENPQKHKNYASVEARLMDAGFPRLKCILYASDGSMNELRGGDQISTELKLSAADIRYGVHTDRYNSKDIYLTGTIKGNVKVIGHRESIASLSSSAAERIAARMDEIFDTDTAPFIKGLVIGDKSELYEDDALYVALSRAGLMHAVAVSGMHVSFLIAFLRFLFGKGKKSALVCILLAWSFVAVSGMTPSAVRAAFMQTMLLIAPLVNRENDPITSLSAALAMLLLINPFSAASVSLQLSFAAMLGIVIFFERIQMLIMKPLGDTRAARLLRAPIAVISCSLSVMVFTLPITAAHFGYVAILSPLTNLLCLWAVPICFIGAFAAAAFFWIPFFGKALAFAVSCLVRYLTAVCRLISSLSFSAVYLADWINTLWIALFYISLALVFLLKIKPRARLLIPLATAIISLLLSHAALKLYYDSARGTITVIDVGQGQCVAAMCGGKTVVIDCGSTSYAEYDAGECACAYLKSIGVNRIDEIIFTHLHADHANGYERLSNLMEIGKLVVSADNDRSNTLLWEILSCAQRHGTEVEFVSESKQEKYGALRIRLFADDIAGSQNERCMPIIVSVDDYDVIITGDAPAEREKRLAKNVDLSQIEAVVVGHHGSDSASCEEYISIMAGSDAIISVGKNHYGLPSTEVLERLKAFGYTVYRTDMDGDVEIRING